jgi:hypothetical protein
LIVDGSVLDPDPYVFGPPGSASESTFYLYSVKIQRTSTDRDRLDSLSLLNSA